MSPVSFLNAKPKIAIFLPVTVLNMERTMFRLKRDFWYSFICTTQFQYSAHSLKP